MAFYFLDTSAIVKRYVLEPGHVWIATLSDPTTGNDLVIAETAIVEVVATLCRKAREAAITEAERDRLIGEFQNDAASGYVIRNVTRDIYLRAGALCRVYTLRAYDAVQLACALAIHDDALVSGSPSPTFVCADNQLLGFASAEGLSTKNPNDYP
jgi:predicted nucleic acid-binding protein